MKNINEQQNNQKKFGDLIDKYGILNKNKKNTFNTTKLRKSIEKYFWNLNDNDVILKVNKYNMEYAWPFCSAMINKNYWFDEELYVIDRFNANSHKSPDYILKNIKNGDTIGLEITSAQIPIDIAISYESSKIRDSKKFLENIKKTFNKRYKQMDGKIENYAIKAYNKKLPKIKNWEKVDKKGLVITFETIKNKMILVHISEILIMLNINNNNVFDYICIVSADFVLSNGNKFVK